jgi:sugar lactone lactonase YvrE
VATSGATSTADAFAAGTANITSLAYGVPAGSAGTLDNPMGVSASGGKVYVSDTEENVLASISGSPATTAIVAGSYEAYGETGDGGPATSATLYQPSGTTVDAAGDIFVADTGDNVVREITPNGTIRLVAGNGTAGLSGNGGPATSGELDGPQAVAVNAAGDLFIADTYNNEIREVTPAGVITDFAGDGTPGYTGDNGPASQAWLTQPSSVAVDSSGNVYIADSGNNVIRRVDAGTGVITTVAGNYAADQSNDGLGAFSGDGGLATLAQLHDPQGVALDPAGDLFIADTYNNAIREVTPAGVISTVVNQASAGGAAPTLGGESSNVAPTASKLSGPQAVAVDPSTGDLYIADTGNGKVAVVTNLASTGPVGPGPVASAPGAETPEAPVAVALPIVAVGVAGGLFMFRRRRANGRTA